VDAWAAGAMSTSMPSAAPSAVMIFFMSQQATLMLASTLTDRRMSPGFPVLLIGAEVLPEKISVKGGACAIALATRRRRALL
jgi:hypothetical protein